MKHLLILLLLIISIPTFGQIHKKDKPEHEHHHGHDEDDEDDGGCLPVDLISFNGKVINRSIKLQWSTATETNNAYYTIFRSPNGFEYWELVSSIQGAGNSNIQRTYTYIDTKPNNGLNYYVLMQTDFNGQRKQYDPIAVFIQLPPEYIVWHYYNIIGQEIK